VKAAWHRFQRPSGGFTLLSVGPSLLLAIWLAGAAPWVPEAGVFPDEFPLFPTMGNEGASGLARLKQPWSPFGVSVDEEGDVQYDLLVRVDGLPEVEGESYRVWLTTPTLESVVPLGTVAPSGEIRGATDLEQLMVVVSREPDSRDEADGERWQGPIVLRGFSAGARVTPMAQHSLFQQTPM